MTDDDVETLVARSWAMTASDGELVPWMDGVPHPRSHGQLAEPVTTPGITWRDWRRSPPAGWR